VVGEPYWGCNSEASKLFTNSVSPPRDPSSSFSCEEQISSPVTLAGPRV
jgi:hypothetical protein